MKFAQAVLEVIGMSGGHLGPLSRSIVSELCDEAEQRPFPVLPWALLIRRHLDNILIVQEKLQQFLEFKSDVRHGIGPAAAANADAIGLCPDARIFVYGYSYMFELVFAALPETLRRSFHVATPLHVRREGKSEGRQLADLLRSHGLDVEVIPDEEARGRLLAKEYDVFLSSAKAVGLYKGADRLAVINTFSEKEFYRCANEAKITVVVTSGRYKIWPTRLFAERAARIEQDIEPFDMVIGGEQISYLLTEQNAFKPEQFVKVYGPPLNMTLEEYPGWWSHSEVERRLQESGALDSIVESFVGVVDDIENGVAHVTLTDRDGQPSFADIDLAELPDGVALHDRFTCNVTRRGAELVLTLTPQRRRPTSAEERKRIAERIADAIPDSLPPNRQ
jgi:hypothetical protein